MADVFESQEFEQAVPLEVRYLRDLSYDEGCNTFIALYLRCSGLVGISIGKLPLHP